MPLTSRPVFSGGRAARSIHTSRTILISTASADLPVLYGSRGVGRQLLFTLAAVLLLIPAALAQSVSVVSSTSDTPPAIAGKNSPPLAEVSPRNLDIRSEDKESEPDNAQQATPATSQTTTPPTQTPAAQQTPAQSGSAVSPDLKGQTSLGDAQLKKQETQRILGVMPAFNSVYEGTVPPLTPKQKFQLMWKSTTDLYVFGFAAFTAGIGQAQNSHAAYGQGVEGYAKRFGANYADTADGNLWGNAILTVALHEDPRYFRMGHGTFTHRLLYSMSTSVWCKRDNGSAGPNYANVFGNLIAGGISNIYYPEADRGVEQTFQSAATVTAEGMIGAALIEFWPDIAHHYKAKKQAKIDAAAKNAQTPSQAGTPPQ